MIIRNFFIGFTIFLIGWIVIDGVVQLTKVMLASTTTIISFVFGMLFVSLLRLAVRKFRAETYHKAVMTNLKQAELRRGRRLEEESMLNTYLDDVAHATSADQLNYYTNKRGINEQKIKRDYKEAGLKDG